MADMEKLKEIIAESGLKKVFIAEKLGISYQGYLKKENGNSEFMANEIAVLKDLLKLSDRDVTQIFLLQK
jgi:DNA-binding XRE family transcriptional regulator